MIFSQRNDGGRSGKLCHYKYSGMSLIYHILY